MYYMCIIGMNYMYITVMHIKTLHMYYMCITFGSVEDCLLTFLFAPFQSCGVPLFKP